MYEQGSPKVKGETATYANGIDVTANGKHRHYRAAGKRK